MFWIYDLKKETLTFVINYGIMIVLKPNEYVCTKCTHETKPQMMSKKPSLMNKNTLKVGKNGYIPLSTVDEFSDVDSDSR